MGIKRFKDLYEKTTENVDNSETFLQKDFNHQDYDYDYILAEMRSKHGWGDLNHNRIEDFEDSDYCKSDLINSDDEYIEHFNMYMKDLSNGMIPDNDEQVEMEISDETPDLPLEEYEETIKKEPNDMKVETEIEAVIPIATNYEVPAECVCKILIINSCEDEKTACTDAFKDNLDCEYKEINLYQLNIKDSKSEEEPKDGMDLIYNEIEGVDAIVFACDGNSMKTCVDRICNHYKEGELKNVIFGAIFNSQSDFNQELTNCAINDLKMIVNGDCISTEGDETSCDATNMALCLTNLCNSTTGLRDNSATDVVEDEIKNYGEFVDEHQTEDPTDLSLEDDLPEVGTEDHDDFIEDLKGEVSKDLAMPFSDDDDDDDDDDDEMEEEEEEVKDEKKDEKKDKTSVGKGPETVKGQPRPDKTSVGDAPETVKGKNKTEEEEERLIDNLDGTVTDINKGWKDTNRPKGNPQTFRKDDKKIDEEEETVVVNNKPNTDYALPFSAFDDVWEKYEESKSEKPFDEFVAEYHYSEWDNIKEDEEEIDIEEEAEAIEADVPNDKIRKMNYQELMDLVGGSQTLSMDELEIAINRMGELDKAGNGLSSLPKSDIRPRHKSTHVPVNKEYDYRKDNFDHPWDNTHSEYEEEIVEEEDTVNSKIDKMSYAELVNMIENEDGLSMDELERAINRVAEMDANDNVGDVSSFQNFDHDELINEYEEDVVEEAVEEEEEECKCGEDCKCEDCKCKKEDKANESKISSFNDFK